MPELEVGGGWNNPKRYQANRYFRGGGLVNRDRTQDLEETRAPSIYRQVGVSADAKLNALCSYLLSIDASWSPAHT